jgi:hypothetical protein
MRRSIVGFCLISTLALLTAVAGAQETTPAPSAADEQRVVVSPPAQLLDGGAWEPIELTLELVDNMFPAQPAGPMSVAAAADSCASATTLLVPGGDQSAVGGFTTDPNDPILSCMWPGFTHPQGYRTAWYRFTPPRNGQVTIDTFHSSYDTVLAVYAGGCDNLAMLACNDDAHGFTSRVTLSVVRGQTYYVEVADWQSGAAASPTLSVAAVLEPVETAWQEAGAMALGRSRHATAVVGEYIYVLGGQTAVGGTIEMSNRVDRLHTPSGTWDDAPQDMPGFGYSNTTAVYVNGQIHMPNGFNGGTYDATHWVHNVAANSWFMAAPIGAFGWAAAAAVPDNSGYYLTGGSDSLDPNLQVRNQTHFYSVATNQWESRPPMGSARYAHMAAWVGGRLCVAGGVSNGAVLLTNGECFNGSSWTLTGNMNYPRYAAGSAVGPDGKWYVFGGIGEDGPVEVTEYYDPVSNSWIALGAAYDLGGLVAETRPARAWPRGGFIGSTLWAIGGNTVPGNLVLPLVERLFRPPPRTFFPFVAIPPTAPVTNDSFATAWGIPLNFTMLSQFDHTLDFYDVYFFDLPAPTAVTVRLSQIPQGSDYNVSIYDPFKLLWGRGENPGNLDEAVPLILGAGRYYVVVERVFPAGPPNTALYALRVEG